MAIYALPDKLTGDCIGCGSASIAAFDGGGWPLVRCTACGLVANATTTTSPLQIPTGRTSGVPAPLDDMRAALEDIEDALSSASGAVDDALEDIRAQLRDLEGRVERKAAAS